MSNKIVTPNIDDVYLHLVLESTQMESSRDVRNDIYITVGELKTSNIIYDSIRSLLCMLSERRGMRINTLSDIIFTFEGEDKQNYFTTYKVANVFYNQQVAEETVYYKLFLESKRDEYVTTVSRLTVVRGIDGHGILCKDFNVGTAVTSINGNVFKEPMKIKSVVYLNRMFVPLGNSEYISAPPTAFEKTKSSLLYILYKIWTTIPNFLFFLISYFTKPQTLINLEVGMKGEKGYPGERGTDGSVIITESRKPDDDDMMPLNQGDYFLNRNTGEYYQLNSNFEWVPVFHFSKFSSEEKLPEITDDTGADQKHPAGFIDPTIKENPNYETFWLKVNTAIIQAVKIEVNKLKSENSTSDGLEALGGIETDVVKPLEELFQLIKDMPKKSLLFVVTRLIKALKEEHENKRKK